MNLFARYYQCAVCDQPLDDRFRCVMCARRYPLRAYGYKSVLSLLIAAVLLGAIYLYSAAQEEQRRAPALTAPSLSNISP